MAIKVPLESLIIPPPTEEPDWVKQLVAAKPNAGRALEGLIGIWPEDDTRSDAEILAELKEFTSDPPETKPKTRKSPVPIA